MALAKSLVSHPVGSRSLSRCRMMTYPLFHMMSRSEDQEVGVFAVGSHLGHAILILQNGPTGIDGELAGTQDQSGHRGTIIVLAPRRSQYRERIRRGIGGR